MTNKPVQYVLSDKYKNAVGTFSVNSKTSNLTYFVQYICCVLYVNWLHEDMMSSWKIHMMSSWKCTDSSAEIPRYTSKHPFVHPVLVNIHSVFLGNFVSSDHLAQFRMNRLHNYSYQNAPVLLMPPVCLIASSPLSSLSKSLSCFKNWNRWDRLPFSDARTWRGRMSQYREGKHNLTVLFLCLLGFLT